MSTITFLGAAETVTGSRHLIEHAGKKILLDCGLFQGLKELRLRNWEPFPIPPNTIDAVVISHAHIDHTGWLPRLVRDGFTGPIYCTLATRDLLAIMLPDSARIQEEEANYANRKRYSKHSPALPLYTEDDALRVLPLLQAHLYDRPTRIAKDITLTLSRAGHILGSAVVYLDLEEPAGQKVTIGFSGDLGRMNTPVIPDPDPMRRAHYLLVESTYGNRSHGEFDPEKALKEHVLTTVRDHGVLLIPAFSVGRTQSVLYHLRQLQLRGEIPPIPIFVDSPMAIDATALYLAHREEHDDAMVRMIADGEDPIHPERVHFTRSTVESRRINEHKGPAIIISASGMATGGRILHHMKHRLPRETTTMLFVGYQAAGTRGQKLLAGDRSIKIHGEWVSVKAKIAQIDGFSAHADADEIDAWLATAPSPPTKTFCVHGEEDSLSALHKRLTERGWPSVIPKYNETFTL